jgi:hypothetical protein
MRLRLPPVPKPVAAFLDMVVMVTLGRMVFEQHYANIHGSEVVPIVDGFKKAEADIWQIAGDILTAEQQQKLMRLIQTWRQNNPKNIVFSSVRFSEFEKFRGFSDDSGKKSSGGLFRSVAKATEQVEEMRLISERAMYLGSRLPMLTGAFADVWTSRLTNNQDVNVILADVNRIADGLQRIAAVSEKLPDDIAIERDTTINKVMQEVAQTATGNNRRLLGRRKTDPRFVNGFETDACISGNDLLTSTNATLDRLNFGQGEMGSAEPSRPFDIRDYQAALQEASTSPFNAP